MRVIWGRSQEQLLKIRTFLARCQVCRSYEASASFTRRDACEAGMLVEPIRGGRFAAAALRVELSRN